MRALTRSESERRRPLKVVGLVDEVATTTASWPCAVASTVRVADSPCSMTSQRRLLWMKDDPLGMEHADVEIGDGGLEATSTALGTCPVAYRLDLALRADAAWVTRRLALRATGDGVDPNTRLGTW
jgi:hypothetical protein